MQELKFHSLSRSAIFYFLLRMTNFTFNYTSLLLIPFYGWTLNKNIRQMTYSRFIGKAIFFLSKYGITADATARIPTNEMNENL